MGTRVPTTAGKHSGRAAHRRGRIANEHALELWCLLNAIELGTWAAAGINREVMNGEVAGYWKRLRCGCLMVVDCGGVEL